MRILSQIVVFQNTMDYHNFVYQGLPCLQGYHTKVNVHQIHCNTYSVQLLRLGCGDEPLGQTMLIILLLSLYTSFTQLPAMSSSTETKSWTLIPLQKFLTTYAADCMTSSSSSPLVVVIVLGDETLLKVSDTLLLLLLVLGEVLQGVMKLGVALLQKIYEMKQVHLHG